MSKKVAVILSGAGVYDGSEINEAVLSLLFLEEAGIAYQCFAPDSNQHHVINHLTGDEINQTRNVLIESARIVRGKIKPLHLCNMDDYHGLLLPGGFGAAKNLSDFAFAGDNIKIDPQLLAVCRACKDAKKPAAYMCIAPVLLPRIYENIKCSIGNDAEVAQVIERLGGQHQNARVDEIVIDTDNKVVTTPAYMLANNLLEAKSGIQRLVNAFSEML
ncbi:MAG: isoprenoid biosynthesis glyoxalase ElbB [Cellvibrionaceae bacterium]|nr:isoprenoid biosynthesis glyoxalase ElbB [Cellvibrionaceae bacterium]